MLESLPPNWVVVSIVARAARGAYADALHSAVCAGRVRLWELGDYSLTRVCPPASINASTWADEAWKVLQHLVAEGALAPPAGFVGQHQWVTGWPFANEVQAHPLTLATIPTERYIVFQPDGMLCGPTTAAALDAFAPYAYVGAPWPWENGPVVGGNGGFSWRNKTIILRIVREFGGTWNNEHEDGWFGSRVMRVGGTLPSPEVAGTWSAELIYSAPPLGFHKPWGHIADLGAENFSRLVRECAVLPRVMALLNVSLSSAEMQGRELAAVTTVDAYRARQRQRR